MPIQCSTRNLRICFDNDTFSDPPIYDIKKNYHILTP